MAKGRRISQGSLPAWYKGRKLRENYSGFPYYAREGKLFLREGKLVDRQNFDLVTDKERAEQIATRNAKLGGGSSSWGTSW